MRTLALTSALALAALPLVAHAKHQAPKTTEEAQKIHKVEKLAEGAFCIFGQGGNIGLIVTDKHAVLIDDQFERLAPGLLAAIKTVTDKPIKYLVNTHFHGDHTGANLVLEKQVMAIVAHTNVRKRLEVSQAKLEPARRGGLPELALGDEDARTRARLDIHLDGTDIHLLHLGPGHTDGDVMVGIPAKHVIHMGDTFILGMLPIIDTDGGGGFDGLVAQIEVVASFIPEDSKVIPGHGPVAGKKELVRYRDFLRAMQAHVKANSGKKPKELAESFDTKAWPEWKQSSQFVTWESLFAAASGQGPGIGPRP
jgi:glyoxylase-like metal-dependent hydrolase (beta-lactamase superfamily II)